MNHSWYSVAALPNLHRIVIFTVTTEALIVNVATEALIVTVATVALIVTVATKAAMVPVAIVALIVMVSTSAKKSAEKSMMTAMFMVLAHVYLLANFVGHWNRCRALHPGHLVAPLVGHLVALLVVSMPVALLGIVSLAFLMVVGLALIRKDRYMFNVLLLVVCYVLSVALVVGVAVSVIIMVEKTPAASAKADDCEDDG